MRIGVLRISTAIIKKALLLPDEYVILGITPDIHHGVFHVAIASESFPDTSEGELIPEITGVYTTEKTGKITAEFKIHETTST